MKKKLILLPILLVPCFLSACDYRTEHIKLQEILDINDGHDSRIYVTEGIAETNYEYFDNIDYDLSAYKIFQENLKDAELVGLTDGLGNINEFVSYSFNLNDKYKKMSSFFIYTYKDGTVITYCNTAVWPIGPKDQYTKYKVDKTTADAIFEQTKAFIQSVEEYGRAKKEEARQKASLSNFFEAFKNKADRKVDYYIHARAYPIDTNEALIADLMDLDYEEVDRIYDPFATTYSRFIKCNINDDWTFIIDSSCSLAKITYKYEGKYRPARLEVYYKVNVQKLNTIKEKLESIVEEQRLEEEQSDNVIIR